MRHYTQLTSPEIRAELRIWTIRNRWTAEQIVEVMRKCGMSTVPSARRLRDFSAGSTTMHHCYLVCLRAFMREYATPGDFETCIATIADVRREQILNQEQEITARRIAREQEIAEHRKTWLAREGQRKPVDYGVLFGLDKETIFALSGGVRT